MAFVTFVWHARFVSSSLILCSIRKCAVLMACGAPLIVTIRFLVPGANVPFFEIWILAPEMCWISMRLRPPGPVRLIRYLDCLHRFLSKYFCESVFDVCRGLIKAENKNRWKKKQRKIERNLGLSFNCFTTNCFFLNGSLNGAFIWGESVCGLLNFLPFATANCRMEANSTCPGWKSF